MTMQYPSSYNIQRRRAAWVYIHTIGNNMQRYATSTHTHLPVLIANTRRPFIIPTEQVEGEYDFLPSILDYRRGWGWRMSGWVAWRSGEEWSGAVWSGVRRGRAM